MVVPPITPSRFVPRKQVQSPGETLATEPVSVGSEILPELEAALDLARNCSSAVGVHRQCRFIFSRESAPSSRMKRKQLHVAPTTRTKPSRADRIWSFFAKNNHPTMTVATSGNPVIHKVKK